MNSSITQVYYHHTFKKKKENKGVGDYIKGGVCVDKKEVWISGN